MTLFPTKILLAIDGSDDAHQALGLAVGITKSTNSELHLVHVEDVVAMSKAYAVPDVQRESAQVAQQLLDEQAEHVEDAGASVAERHLLAGRPADEIIHLAEDIGAGLIITGSRGRGGIQRLLMGSVSETLVRYAHCPVLVARGQRVEKFPTRILLATDGSEDSELAAQAATELAGKTDSELHLIHASQTRAAPPTPYQPVAGGAAAVEPLEAGEAPVVERDPVAEEDKLETREQKVLDQQARQIEEAGGVIAEKYPRRGLAAREIIDLSEEIEAGLIVMGSRGLRGLERAVMGSVSESVVRHAHCPVMVVRQEVRT